MFEVAAQDSDRACSEATLLHSQHVCRVGQNRIYTPYMTVCMVISLFKIPYIYRINVCIYGLGQPYTNVPIEKHTPLTPLIPFPTSVAISSLSSPQLRSLPFPHLSCDMVALDHLVLGVILLHLCGVAFKDLTKLLQTKAGTDHVISLGSSNILGPHQTPADHNRHGTCDKLGKF